MTELTLEKLSEKYGDELTSLTKLDLSCNYIPIQPGTFTSFTSLTELDLSFNRIPSIQPGSFPTSLTYLNLRFNWISSIQHGSFKTTSLTLLDLSFNKIESIPITFFQRISSLWIRENTFSGKPTTDPKAFPTLKELGARNVVLNLEF